MEKKRAEFVDIAKGIAIISVIIGHTWSVYSPMDKRLTIFTNPSKNSPTSSGSEMNCESEHIGSR